MSAGLETKSIARAMRKCRWRRTKATNAPGRTVQGLDAAAGARRGAAAPAPGSFHTRGRQRPPYTRRTDKVWQNISRARRMVLPMFGKFRPFLPNIGKMPGKSAGGKPIEGKACGAQTRRKGRHGAFWGDAARFIRQHKGRRAFGGAAIAVSQGVAAADWLRAFCGCRPALCPCI